MDWLRQIPIGQYVPGSGSWLRQLDARQKLAWTLAFLLTPILAGPLWRLALVGLLLLVTALSGLPWRLWRRSLPLLLALALFVGALSSLLPTGSSSPASPSRPPTELRLAPAGADGRPPSRMGLSWELVHWGPLRVGPVALGPLVVTRRSGELGISSATLSWTSMWRRAPVAAARTIGSSSDSSCSPSAAESEPAEPSALSAVARATAGCPRSST